MDVGRLLLLSSLSLGITHKILLVVTSMEGVVMKH